MTVDLHGEASSARVLWSTFPPELAEAFRPHIDSLTAEVIADIQRTIPEYARPLDRGTGRNLAEAVREAIVCCVDAVAASSVTPGGSWQDVFRHRGKLEFLQGRTLDLLQTAYRVGGRTAWRYVSEVYRSMNVAPEILCLGAEAIMAFVDELSRLSLEGYAEAEARAAGALRRRRRRLVRLIFAQPAVTRAAITELAESAQWPLPERLTVVALERRAGQPDRTAPDLDPDLLHDLESDEPCLIIGDTERQLPGLDTALAGWHLAISPEVSFTDAPTALRWARRALALRRRGILPDDPVIHCVDHLSTLWLFSDEPLIAALVRQSLAPLRGLTANKRSRLAETLLTWLETRGSAAEIGKTLGVHQQTVRYRLHQLETLFGDRLNNPDDRLDVELALRAERLLGARIPDTGGRTGGADSTVIGSSDQRASA